MMKMKHVGSSLFLVVILFLGIRCGGQKWPPEVVDPETSPVLSPEEALASMVVPPGFRVELVAAEPLVEDPVAIDIDPEGRIYAAEMRGWMNDIEGGGALEPIGSIAVLQDTDGDGRMDERTVFLDSLVLPRAVKVLSDGVLVGEPPYLWFARDRDGDLVADEKVAVSERFGIRKPNPESNANGLVWSLDNWIHTTEHDRRYRRTGGRWVEDSTLAVGQFGLTMDDYGRMYRNSNSSPVYFDYIQPHYYARNPNLPKARGMEEAIAEDRQVWPVRTTPGANRGYQESTLREDGTLRTFTAASGPGVYRGDTYPEAFTEKVNIFVPEPVGNLVHRYVIEEQDDGTVAAVHGYEGGAFLASTDERFRPVNTYSAPDGTLYVVDLYRGVIEHRDFQTTYLRERILEKDLVEPVGLGRIYRIAYEDTPPRSEPPRLADASSEELVEHLSHPNGWWRDTAQRLLVERGDAAVVPALREMARSAEDVRTRLHALWTLEGLGALEAATVRQAFADASPHVRAAAVRLAELWLRQGSPPMLEAVAARVEDPSPAVRLQLAVSLGEAPAETADSALTALLTRHADQPYLVEAVVSGLHGRELAFLEQLLQEQAWQEATAGYQRAVQTLASAVVNGGDPAQVDSVLGQAAAAGDPQWQRLALLEGVEALLPPARGVVLPLELPRQPTVLARLVEANDDAVRRKAEQLIERLTWPGKPGSESRVERLTPEARQRYEQGRVLFLAQCATCHGEEGRGREGVGAPLVGSEWVHGSHQNLVRILLHGKEGDLGLMPPQRNLTDEDIAAVLTYIRNAWGNQAYLITPDQAADVRMETAAREQPWTDPELEATLH